MMSNRNNKDNKKQKVNFTAPPTISPTKMIYTPPPVPSSLGIDMNVPDTSTLSWSSSHNEYTIKGDLPGERFGHASSLSYDGTILAVSSYAYQSGTGRVATYRFLDDLTYEEFGSGLNGTNIGFHYGASLILSGDGYTLVVGEPDYSSSLDKNKQGQVLIYHYETEQDVWIMEDAFVGYGANDSFGSSVDVNYDGTMVIVGAYRGDVNVKEDVGYVCVYELQRRGGWTLFASNDSKVGEEQYTLSGQTAFDYFGTSVSMSASGKRIAVGIPGKDDAGDGSGGVSIYDYNDYKGLWVKIGHDLLGISSRVSAGMAISLSGDGLRLAIASPEADDDDANMEDVGLVCVYGNVYNTAKWEQVGNGGLYGKEEGERIGSHVKLNVNGTILVYSSVLFNGGRGRVDVYQDIQNNSNNNNNNNGSDETTTTTNMNVWERMNMGGMITGVSSSDSTGSSIGLSARGYRLVVGTEFGDVGGEGSGHVLIYDY
eukprot:4933197-Ditylum_brightwellii.AAC.1